MGPSATAPPGSEEEVGGTYALDPIELEELRGPLGGDELRPSTAARHKVTGTSASRSSPTSSSRRRTSEASVGSSPNARSTSTSVARPVTIE